MSPAMLELLWRSFLETLIMTGAAGAISLAFGLPLGLLLVATDKGGIWERPAINRVLGGLVNAARSVPFIILLVAVIPLTRVIVGTSIGVAAAIVPLSLAAIPYYARIAEVSLREVEPGLIEAARAMGGNRWTIIREVLIPESLPGLISGFTVTLVTLVGASAMAGAVGSGGLGDMAIRYGYQRFETDVMIVVVLVLIALVCAVQWIGDRTASASTGADVCDRPAEREGRGAARAPLPSASHATRSSTGSERDDQPSSRTPQPQADDGPRPPVPADKFPRREASVRRPRPAVEADRASPTPARRTAPRLW
jgi:D-methionine transport system permease protein